MNETAPLTQSLRDTLIGIAQRSIETGYGTDEATPINLAPLPGELQIRRATFVTLRLNTELQGCIGTLRPIRPLAEDVNYNAWAAAFLDRRGVTLLRSDLSNLHIHISILGEPEPIEAQSEEELLQKIRPGIDGLIVQEGEYRGTLLPSVWEALPDPRAFVQQVKLKADLPAEYWSPTLRFQRYTTESFSN